jgi:hypothetical protein
VRKIIRGPDTQFAAIFIREHFCVYSICRPPSKSTLRKASALLADPLFKRGYSIVRPHKELPSKRLQQHFFLKLKGHTLEQQENCVLFLRVHCTSSFLPPRKGRPTLCTFLKILTVMDDLTRAVLFHLIRNGNRTFISVLCSFCWTC